MRYIIDIRIDGKSRTYPVEASSEGEAIERLKLRLPPHQREHFDVDSIKIDMATVGTDDPYGSFGGE